MLKYYLLAISLVLVVGDDIKCKQCDSLQTKECATAPDIIVGFCTSNSTQGCFSYLDGEITRRNCVGPPKCETSTCMHCTSENCNIDTVPDDRKLCLQCEGKENCATPDSSLKAAPCQHYKANDTCLTYVSDEGNAYRGCGSDDLKACKDNESLCKTCSNNGCNTEPAVQKQTCLECSSKSDNGKLCKRPEKPGESCNITITQTCEESVLLGRDAKCYIQFDGEVVTRGCGSKNLPSQGYIETCKEQNCNYKCALEPSCYVCDSTSSPGCKTTQLDSFSKKCTDYAISCSTCENKDSSRIERGCGQNTPEGFICNSCRGDNCNKEEKLPKSCYICDSKSNPKCARNEDIEAKFCSSANEKCYVQLNADGSTVRGCIEDANCKEGCEGCTGHNCNTQILAKRLIQCYKCNDGDGCAKNQRETNNNATECSAPGDSCYMISKDDKIMQRGCLSEVDTPNECKNNDTKCVKCRTSQCNSIALNGKPDLKCIQCKDDLACPWRHLPTKADVCGNDIPYTQQELCYTLTLADGSTERGCLSQQSECTLQNRDCRVCYDDACNTLATQTYSCIRCRSDVDPECKKTNPKIEPTPCVNAPLNATRGCYSENDDGVVIRGCLADMSDLSFVGCGTSSNKLCVPCYEQGCNHNEVKSSSTIISASVSIVLWSFLILGRFL